MKLKTKMEGPCVHTMGVCIDPENAHHKQVMHLEHDAAVAHALVMALAEPINPDYMFHGEQYRDSVMGRALDLMELWGYGDGGG